MAFDAKAQNPRNLGSIPEFKRDFSFFKSLLSLTRTSTVIWVMMNYNLTSSITGPWRFIFKNGALSMIKITYINLLKVVLSTA